MLLQGTDEWHRWRAAGIGSSDAAPILGVCPWRTARDVYEEKRNGVVRPANPAMRRGTYLEPVARADYERTVGVVVQPALRVHPALEWLRGSFDGLTIDGDHFLEVKCPGDGTFATIRATNIIPEHYRPQVQHLFAVSGARTGDFWCWHPDHGGIRIPVERDDAFIATLLEAEEAFWRMVQAGTPPPLPPGHEERTDAPWLSAAQDYVRSKAIVDEHTGRLDAARELLIALMGDGIRVTGGGVSLTKYARKGNVQYARVPSLKGVDLDAYRAPATEAVRITITEE